MNIKDKIALGGFLFGVLLLIGLLITLIFQGPDPEVPKVIPPIPVHTRFKEVPAEGAYNFHVITDTDTGVEYLGEYHVGVCKLEKYNTRFNTVKAPDKDNCFIITDNSTGIQYFTESVATLEKVKP